MNYTIPFSIDEPKKLSQCKDYLFDEYNYYYNEREKFKKEIILSLNDKTTSYSFKNWFRLTRTKYAIDPLNCKGSVKDASGGRFNIGSIKKDRFPLFPALYIGSGKYTCIKEHYSGMEHFYNSNQGDSFFCISGCIHSLLDITAKGSLNKFVKTIKQVTLSEQLKKRFKKLDVGEYERESIQNITQLKKSIYNKNWREAPNIYDIPALPQIFGQLTKEAGIEAILYKSTKTSKTGLCMAVFPENFKNSDSYIKLEDCPKAIVNRKMDSETFENFY